MLKMNNKKTHCRNITACHDKKKPIYLFFSFQQRCEEKLWYKSNSSAVFWNVYEKSLAH
jgi:hypothetical protein